MRPAEFDPTELAPLGVALAALTADSRQVQPGVAFAAYPGESLDGRDFIPQAIANGACAVLWERRGFAWKPEWRVPNLGIENLREKVGPIASQVYGHPSKKMWVVGVTGTNGKTTCSHWIAQGFASCGSEAAVIGTLGNGIYPDLESSLNTTPDAVALQRELARYVEAGVHCVAMEASSHGLEQGRVNGVQFDVALFTNLSRDHLDYHGDMESYAAAKARLFEWPGLRHAVLNLDEPFGAELAKRLEGGEAQVIGYGLGRGQVCGRDLEASAEGVRMKLESPWGSATVEAPVLGVFNAHNLLATLAVLLASGIGLDEAVRAARAFRPVAGRLERLGGGGQPLVVVDYAHTPDALEKVLQTLRELLPAARRLTCVFGCGGDRDRGKRPQMGEIAARLADRVIVTSDNPRSESPSSIIGEIVAGIRAGNYAVEEDRATAIHRAVGSAQPGDIVLIAGKGHETYQEVQGVRLPFSDAQVAAEALRARQG